MITSMPFACLLLNTVRARLDFLVVNTEYLILEIPLDPQDMDDCVLDYLLQAFTLEQIAWNCAHITAISRH